MLPKDQVKQIVMMFGGAAATDDFYNLDAVFFVRKYITDTNRQIKDLQKKLAKAEATIEALKKKK